MGDSVLYLEDLQSGQQFVTQPYTVTEDDIFRFAREFDPQPPPRATRSSVASPAAAGTLPH